MSLPQGWRLPYDQLAAAVRGLPGWTLHASGVTMTREVSFSSSGPALLFVQAAGFLARLERRWPEISWARERVRVSLINFELGLTEQDLAFARELEKLLAECEKATLPEPPLPPASLTDLEELAEGALAAVRGVAARVGGSRGSARPGPLRLALEALPDWKPEIDGDGLASEFELATEAEARDFLRRAQALAQERGSRVELMAVGSLIGAVVRPSDIRGLGEREITTAGALERLYGEQRGRAMDTSQSACQPESRGEQP